METVHLYTDGSCKGNPGPGGWAVILKHGPTNAVRELCGGYSLTTNNRMELTAAIEGLSALKQQCIVELYSDSKYVCDGIGKGWIWNWQQRGWRRNNGKPVPNADLWKKLLPLLGRHEVHTNWIRGHNEHKENERCDALAKSMASPLMPMDTGYLKDA